MHEIQLITAKAANSQNPEYTLAGGSDDGSGNGTAAMNVKLAGSVAGTTTNVTLVGAPGVPWLPAGTTFESNSSGNVANATATATLAGAVGKTTFVTGFSITGAGATAASVVTATLSGVIGGPLSYTFAVPAGVTVGAYPLIVELDTPIPSSAANTPISISLPALGAGNTNATVSIHGYVV